MDEHTFLNPDGENKMIIRSIIIDKDPWFVATDVAKALGYVNPHRAIVTHCKSRGVTKRKAPAKDGSIQEFSFINEGNLYRLIFRSKLPAAEAFEDWIVDTVLPSIRKTGSYTIKNHILDTPKVWQKLFPDEFKHEVMNLYGHQWNPKYNTPQFVGRFINTYIYNQLDPETVSELKKARSKSKTNGIDFLHQYLEKNATSVATEHITIVITLMKASPTPEVFKKLYENVFNNTSQLKLKLKGK